MFQGSCSLYSQVPLPLFQGFKSLCYKVPTHFIPMFLTIYCSKVPASSTPRFQPPMFKGSCTFYSQFPSPCVSKCLLPLLPHSNSPCFKVPAPLRPGSHSSTPRFLHPLLPGSHSLCFKITTPSVARFLFLYFQVLIALFQGSYYFYSKFSTSSVPRFLHPLF